VKRSRGLVPCGAFFPLVFFFFGVFFPTLFFSIFKTGQAPPQWPFLAASPFFFYPRNLSLKAFFNHNFFFFFVRGDPFEFLLTSLFFLTQVQPPGPPSLPVLFFFFSGGFPIGRLFLLAPFPSPHQFLVFWSTSPFSLFRFSDYLGPIYYVHFPNVCPPFIWTSSFRVQISVPSSCDFSRNRPPPFGSAPPPFPASKYPHLNTKLPILRLLSFDLFFSTPPILAIFPPAVPFILDLFMTVRLGPYPSFSSHHPRSSFWDQTLVVFLAHIGSPITLKALYSRRGGSKPPSKSLFFWRQSSTLPSPN